VTPTLAAAEVALDTEPQKCIAQDPGVTLHLRPRVVRRDILAGRPADDALPVGAISIQTAVTALIRLSLAVLVCQLLTSFVEAQTPAGGGSLELHAGYGGGGTHPDGLVGGSIAYRFAANLDAIGFVTAVTARPTGRAVFVAPGLRLTPVSSAVRPYLAVGPLFVLRSYDVGHLGGFASLGVETVIAGPPRDWELFAEGRTMRGGSWWSQLVGGVRATIFTK
jgi:hypothetical protein